MGRYLAITGGIGGAKLALGLSQVLEQEEITFAVNTGDDFEHLGLTICPDLDTLCYTLSGLANTELGWGRGDETWHCLETLRTLGGEDWFALGDRDLALHLLRTSELARGRTLTEVTATLCARLGIRHPVLPMSNDPVRTLVHTDQGTLPFQHYFVRDRCEPAVSGFEFAGRDRAQPNPGILEVLDGCRGIIICPSNPFVSVDPLLSLPGLRQALIDAPAPVVAVSPIVGGQAIKGPTAKMMQELGMPATAAQVAGHYGELLDGLLLDTADAGVHGELPVATDVTGTVMVSLADRVNVARAALALIDRLR